MHFKNIRALSNAAYASYNNDRIIFYESPYSSRDFIGYVRCLYLCS